MDGYTKILMTNYAGTLLTVVAEMQAKPGSEADLRRELLTLVGHTTQEDGCVQYDLHESTATAGQFVFYENWTSAAALEKHGGSAHIQAFRAKASGLLAGPSRIVTYHRIG